MRRFIPLLMLTLPLIASAAKALQGRTLKPVKNLPAGVMQILEGTSGILKKDWSFTNDGYAKWMV